MLINYLRISWDFFSLNKNTLIWNKDYKSIKTSHASRCFLMIFNCWVFQYEAYETLEQEIGHGEPEAF